MMEEMKEKHPEDQLLTLPVKNPEIQQEIQKKL
jgi:hypothetical protein